MGAEVPVASHVSPHPHPQTVSKNLKDSFVPLASLARVLPLSLGRENPCCHMPAQKHSGQLSRMARRMAFCKWEEPFLLSFSMHITPE